jgi:hypothetical protein
MTRSTRILLQIIAVGNGLFLIGLIGSMIMYLRLIVAPITPNGSGHDYTSTWLTAAVVAALLIVELFVLRLLRRERKTRGGRTGSPTIGGAAGSH